MACGIAWRWCIQKPFSKHFAGEDTKIVYVYVPTQSEIETPPTSGVTFEQFKETNESYYHTAGLDGFLQRVGGRFARASIMDLGETAITDAVEVV